MSQAILSPPSPAPMSSDKAHGLLRHVMPRLALEITEDERRAKYLKHVAASHSSSKIDNMLKEAAASMALRPEVRRVGMLAVAGDSDLTEP